MSALVTRPFSLVVPIDGAKRIAELLRVVSIEKLVQLGGGGEQMRASVAASLGKLGMGMVG